MKCVIKSAGILSVLLILVGCASSHVIKAASPMMFSKPVSMDVIYVTIASSTNCFEAERNELSDAVISGLKASAMFTTVTGDKTALGSGNGIKINAEIKEIKRVTDDAREWAGALAGHAHILVEVTVSDLKSGNKIEVFEVVGQSGASAFAGTTDEAIQRATQKIVTEFLKLNAQTGL